MLAQSVGVHAHHYPCLPERGFLPSIQALEERIQAHNPRVLILNSPSNPSGVVFPAEVVQELVELAAQNDLWVLSDEVYDELVFDGGYVSPVRFDRDGRVISVFSFSKTYAMTGWRLGYVVAPDEVSEQIQKLQEPFVSCASSISQKAGEAALLGPQDCVQEMVQTYQRRRDVVIDILNDYGMYEYTPQGAFYILLDVSAAKLDSRSFALTLLREKQVAVAPGQAFGDVARGYIRVCLAAQDSALIEGLERVRSFILERAPGAQEPAPQAH
jgi:aspartate aminotransferase/aminotransferase